MSELTEDRLLDGRVLLRQPARGFRAGLDAVLLAAAVPARPGERVLEAGSGSGAGFLCLAARVPGLRIVAVERQPALAALARENAVANGLDTQVEVVEGDIGDAALARALGPFDHGFANPPYWSGGTPPPTADRRAATHELQPLERWVRFLAAGLRHKGSVTLVLPAARFDAAAAALRAAGCGGLGLLPLWPRAGLAAKRVLLSGRAGDRGPARILPGLVLHEAGGFSAAAERVLRGAEALG